jgi:16S rRNA processing protein RimM
LAGESRGGGDDARICLGIITGAHGVRGRVRIKSFTAEPQAIAGYGALESEAGDRRFELEITGAGKGVLIARIDGIGDRDAAERLKGTRLYVRRAALPPPEAEEFYQADLVGLEARRSDGTPMGRVSAVHDFGAGASLEIEDAAGKTLLVPFTRSAVPQIDIAGGILVIVPPEGLIDAPKPAEGAGP